MPPSGRLIILSEAVDQYPCCMSIVTAESVSLRAAIAAHRDAVAVILRRYRATNPRLFGSVARGDATRGSDIDVLVDLLPGGGNDLLRVAGVAEEMSQLLGLRVDVLAESLLRDEVSSSALADAVPLRPDPSSPSRTSHRKPSQNVSP